MSNTTTVMGHLEALRDKLAQLPGVKSCKIGLEANINPGDYPMIRIVPSDMRPHAENPYRMDCECLIYFGQAIQPFDGEPDAGGLVRLEKLYASLLALDASIRAAVRSQFMQVMETILDEDRLETYKLMALRIKINGHGTPTI